jgi:2-polyprenyl-3-methyl-5-hydroxy-6-metoxy-1,4-benzoquinol methylase
MYYHIPFDEEIIQVNKAVNYYLDWAREFRTIKYDWDFLHTYYKGLLDPTQTTRIQFRALFFAMRLQPVLSYIQQFKLQHNSAPRILDLGCGMGLESLLLSLAGAVVHGIDPWSEMIKFAQYRQTKYQAHYGIQLNLDYEHINLFKYTPSEPYDAVYSSATLHHIEPVSDAIKKISQLIKPDGYFFLSDENGLSPVQQLAVQKKIGWIHPRKFWRIDSDTGERYLYGNENIRATFLWGRYMRDAGLKPQTIKYCRFLPPLERSVEWSVKWERGLRSIPILTELTAIGFLLSAKKIGTL